MSHFKKIELTLKGIGCFDTRNVLVKAYPYYTQNGYAVINDLMTIFNQKSNQEYPINQYPINEYVIQIAKVKQGLQSFGVIYQNVVAWLRERQIRCGHVHYNTAVKNCKIVFNWC